MPSVHFSRILLKLRVTIYANSLPATRPRIYVSIPFEQRKPSNEFFDWCAKCWCYMYYSSSSFYRSLNQMVYDHIHSVSFVLSNSFAMCQLYACAVHCVCTKCDGKNQWRWVLIKNCIIACIVHFVYLIEWIVFFLAVAFLVFLLHSIPLSPTSHTMLLHTLPCPRRCWISKSTHQWKDMLLPIVVFIHVMVVRCMPDFFLYTFCMRVIEQASKTFYMRASCTFQTQTENACTDREKKMRRRTIHTHTHIERR